MFRSFISPISLLVGTTIGAGIFSLPYVFSKSGLLAGIIYLIVLSGASFIIHLIYADVVVRTYESHHRFPGYAKIYLGKYGEVAANLIISATLLLMLTIYLILSTSFASLIFPQMPEYLKIFVFWILGSVSILFSIKKEVVFESITSFLTVSVILIIFAAGISNFLDPAFAIKKSVANFDFKYLFLPLGPVLFSLIGQTAIPPIVVYFKNENLELSKVKNVIFWGIAIPALFYLLFVLGIFGLSDTISSDAVSGLIGKISPFFLALLGLFGFVSLWDSYSSIGSDIKKIMNYDWNLEKTTSTLLVVLVPLLLYFAGLQNFLTLIGFVGGILISLWALLVVAIWKKSLCRECPQKIINRLNPLLIYSVVIIFIGAIVYEITGFF